MTSFASQIYQGSREQLVNGASSFRDPLLYGLLSLGAIGWLLGPVATQLTWKVLLVKALTEELLFRFLLQETIDQFLKRRFRLGPISLANAVTSVLFAAAHLFSQSPAWALLTFFPSLVFGLCWDRYRSVIPCWLVHFFYNFCLFYPVPLSN